mgnify:CR=1 FL=1
MDIDASEYELSFGIDERRHNLATEKLERDIHLTNTDMNKQASIVRDHCRAKLSQYTLGAFDAIALPANPLILDVGCGTGVTTLLLAEKANATFYAVEPDKALLARFQEKIQEKGWEDRFKLIEGAAFDLEKLNHKFDLVLAEGLLNIIGFEKGLPLLAAQLNENGYLIIHDELKDDLHKKKIFRDRKLDLIYEQKLDEKVWWNDYYICLEKGIEEMKLHDFMQSDLNEIRQYRKEPELFQSVIYVLKNNMTKSIWL